jgi:hypothetical protein
VGIALRMRTPVVAYLAAVMAAYSASELAGHSVYGIRAAQGAATQPASVPHNPQLSGPLRPHLDQCDGEPARLSEHRIAQRGFKLQSAKSRSLCSVSTSSVHPMSGRPDGSSRDERRRVD